MKALISSLFICQKYCIYYYLIVLWIRLSYDEAVLSQQFIFSAVGYLTQLKSILANGINTYFVGTLKIEVSIIYNIPTVYCSSLPE